MSSFVQCRVEERRVELDCRVVVCCLVVCCRVKHMVSPNAIFATVLLLLCSPCVSLMLGNYSRRDQAPFGGRTYTGCSFYRGVGLVSFIGRARYRHDAPPPFSPNSTTNDRTAPTAGRTPTTRATTHCNRLRRNVVSSTKRRTNARPRRRILRRRGTSTFLVHPGRVSSRESNPPHAARLSIVL